MGILSHAWDVATSFMPAGTIINKLGRSAANYVKENPSIIGKVANAVIPQGIRNKITNVGDAVLKELPDSKIKGALESINSTMKGESPVVKQAVALDSSAEGQTKQSSALVPTSIIKPSAVGVNPRNRYRNRFKSAVPLSSRRG